ncbi:MAG: hypothetical protein JWR19_1117 [Pedosphaera sp.]|nr:hypothetical protein [Pedosphaera sp.]
MSITRYDAARRAAHAGRRTGISTSALRCRRKFLRFFPKGFRDEGYIGWEREYKWEAYEKWNELLNRTAYHLLLQQRQFSEIANQAVKIESRTNLLFSFEKMAIRDAVKSPAGARRFAEGLFDFLHGSGSPENKFKRWIETLAALPRKQTRVVTWPVITVFGFIAQPDRHIFLKPNVTRIAAAEYGFDFHYSSKPFFETYASLLEFAAVLNRDLRDLKPRDMIDIQSFIWIIGSDEFAE